MKNKTLYILLGAAIALLGFVYYYNASAAMYQNQASRSSAFASSTAFSVTASTRVMSTSTQQQAEYSLTVGQTPPMTAGRTSVTFQTGLCAVWLEWGDVTAVANTGMNIAASSTVTFAQDVPMIDGSIRAVSSGPACSLLVTEVRSQF